MTIRAKPRAPTVDLKYEVRIPIFFNVDKVDWFSINDRNITIDEIHHWLHLEFGMINRDWDWEFKANDCVFTFEKDEDAMAFKLRWL